MLLGLLALTVPTTGTTSKFLENYANINVVPEVKRIPGVGDAMVMGADYSMRIWLKPDVMARVQTDAVRRSRRRWPNRISRPRPASSASSGDQSFQYVMRYKGRLQTEEEFERHRRCAPPADGEVLRLKDIANIELGRLTYGFSNHVNGHAGVSVADLPDGRFECDGRSSMNVESYLESESSTTLPPGVDGLCGAARVRTISCSLRSTR